MIGRLEGTVVEVPHDGTIVLDVAGVGYEVFVPLGTLTTLRGGEALTVHVHTHAREDSLMLFGFATLEDKTAFRMLLGVSNVGPKLALAILGVLDAHRLAHAVAHEDRAALKGIPGVGKKTIERILLDLKDRLIVRSGAGAPVANVTRPSTAPSGPLAGVVLALVQMGYKRAEAERAIEGLDPEEDLALSLRKALANLG
jgi:Holliday junction DNA helicase RuvA